MSFKIGVPALPSGYTQLAYIEGNGTQYINTGFVPTSDRISGKFKFNGKLNTEGMRRNPYYCNVNNGSGVAINLDLLVTNLGHPTLSGSFGIELPGVSQPLDRNDQNIDWEWEYLGYVTSESSEMCLLKLCNDEERVYIYLNDYDSLTGNTNPILFFKGNNANLCPGQLYAYSHSENNVLKLNLIPAKRNSDNIVGMYDTVSNTFLTNADASGNNFIAGPEVSGLVYRDIDSLRINSNGSYKRLTALYKKDPDSSDYIQVYSKTYAPLS